MEKAIEIKRRAQRFVQSGDVDAALAEYQRLAHVEENEPYHSVVIADLLFKKGDHAAAARRYLTAVDGYEETGLYKNAIAVCKKMARLSLAPGVVFLRLAQLHALDGLKTESGLYYLQHAEFAVRYGEEAEAQKSLRHAFDASNENVIALERLADLHMLNGESHLAISVLKEAIDQYEKVGQLADANRCRSRLKEMGPDTSETPAPAAEPAAPFSSHEPGKTNSLEGLESSFRAAMRGEDPSSEPASAVPPPEPPSSSRSFTDPSLRELPSSVEPVPVSAPQMDPVAASAPAVPPTLSPAASPPPFDFGFSAEMRSTNGSSDATGENTENDPHADAARATFDRPGLDFVHTTPSGDAAAADDVLLRALLPDAGDDDKLLDLLHQAVESLRTGAPEAATQLLVRAAQAHDAAGSAEAAARVYRSVHASFAPSRPAMMLWFDNCRRRGDRAEGARVACDLGDESQRRGDTQSAREWFERAHALDPQFETANHRLSALGVHASAPARTSTLTAPAPSSTTAPAQDLRTLPEANDPFRIQVTHGSGDHVPMDLLELVETFQAALRGQVSADGESHYALGVSYLEMGLAEQAIESLRTAAEEPTLRARAFELIGRCYMDQGRFEDATVEFQAALDQQGLAPDATINVSFELGIAFEAAGRLDEALETFEKIYEAQPTYPDVAMKIRVLRKTLETE